MKSIPDEATEKENLDLKATEKGNWSVSNIFNIKCNNPILTLLKPSNA